MYENKDFVHQVCKKKNYRSIRMHGQQNVKIPHTTFYANTETGFGLNIINLKA